MNNPNIIPEVRELLPRYKKVLNYIADGLPRYKAWKKEHPNCNSDESARHSVRALLKKPEAKQYLIGRKR